MVQDWQTNVRRRSKRSTALWWFTTMAGAILACLTGALLMTQILR
jgi:hypothetical protein